MILVDTSVWVDHLRAGDAALEGLLNHGQVLMHPFVLGELACGNLRDRGQVLRLLKNLPQAIVASDQEVLFFIERNALMGRGIGYVDAHLLAAVTPGRFDATVDTGQASAVGDRGLEAGARRRLIDGYNGHHQGKGWDTGVVRRPWRDPSVVHA